MIEERHTFEENLSAISEISVTSYKNMAEKRICESTATQVSPTLGISNNNYGPWTTCIVYSDVCLRYRVGEMLLCTVMCV